MNRTDLPKILAVCRCCSKTVRIVPICVKCMTQKRNKFYSKLFEELRKLVEDYKKLITGCGCETCLGNEEVILDVEDILLRFEVGTT